MMKNKKMIYGLVTGIVLLGGGLVLAMGGSGKVEPVSQETSALVQEGVVTTVSTTKDSDVVKDEKPQESTSKVEETTTTVQVSESVTEKPADEKSQTVVVTPTETTTQGNHSQPRQEIATTVQQTTQKPTPVTQPVVTTTRQTTQKQTQAPIQTTRAKKATKTIIIGGMGNSGKEFKTMEEAHAWAYPKMGKQGYGKGYFVLPIVYSDDTQTYTVDWY